MRRQRVLGCQVTYCFARMAVSIVSQPAPGAPERTRRDLCSLHGLRLLGLHAGAGTRVRVEHIVF